MKSMTASVKLALAFFGFDGVKNATAAAIKKAYRRKAIESHPDKGGDNETMKLVNSHFDVIEKFGLDQFESVVEAHSETTNQAKERVKDWLYELNEGHPLFKAKMPSFSTRSRLLAEFFSMREGEDLPGIDPSSEYSKNARCRAKKCNAAYFQLDNSDYVVSWYTGDSDVRVSDITDAGTRGKSVVEYTLRVESWGRDWEEHSRHLSSLLQTCPGVDKSTWCWAQTYKQLQAAIEGARAEYNQHSRMNDLFATVKIFGIEFTSQRQRYNDNQLGSTWKANVNGTQLVIYRSEKKAIDCISPYRIERYKPITDLSAFMGTRKISRHLLIRLLINGQFYRLKRNYRYTDDYAYDAAVGFAEKMIENPLAVAFEWITDSGSCDWIFYRGENHELSFGFHSNDSSGLVIALENAYPTIDILPAGETVDSFIAAIKQQNNLLVA